MPETVNVKATPVLTLSVDLVSLLQAGDLLDYDDETGESRYAPDFLNQIVKEAAALAAKQVLTAELRTVIHEQIDAQVHVAVTAAMDEVVTETDTWGKPKGAPKALRQVLAEKAAAEVQAWMKRGSDGYRSSGSYERFLSDEVSNAVAADLKGALAAARADVKARMETAAAKAIVNAASAAMKGL